MILHARLLLFLLPTFHYYILWFIDHKSFAESRFFGLVSSIPVLIYQLYNNKLKKHNKFKAINLY